MNTLRTVRAAALLVALVSASALAEGNLLTNAKLTRADKIQNPARMTDGTVPTDGDQWNTEVTSVLSLGGVAEWDLGNVATISAGRISADNNDAYFVDVSEDGQTWVPLWRADPVDEAGMRPRQISPIEARARYVRLHAEGGDEMYSVGELELFATAAELEKVAPKKVAPPAPPAPPPACNTTWVAVVGAAALVYWFLRSKVTPAGEQKPGEAAKEEPKKEEPPKDDGPKA